MTSDTGTTDGYQEKLFCYDLDGLSFTVKIYTYDGVSFSAKIIVDEGAADFNAIYWGDDIADGTSENLGGSLNMNGAHDADGDKLDWDGSIKLSDPGLGDNEGTYLADQGGEYLQEGEYMTVWLPEVHSFDDVEYLGIRATSTTTAEGSIKAVAEPYCTSDATTTADDNDAEDPGDAIASPDGADTLVEAPGDSPDTGDGADSTGGENLSDSELMALLFSGSDADAAPADEDIDDPVFDDMLG